jgi:hypothetical protein
MHDASVAKLEKHYKKNKVWYEQVITQDIIDYVKNNQEILSGIREGEWIYNTKFPYSPEKYLEETDSRMKRFYMCRARASWNRRRCVANNANCSNCGCLSGSFQSPLRMLRHPREMMKIIVCS